MWLCDHHPEGFVKPQKFTWRSGAVARKVLSRAADVMHMVWAPLQTVRIIPSSLAS